MRVPTPLPRPKEASRAKKGRTRCPDPSSLVIASGVAHMVIRRVSAGRLRTAQPPTIQSRKGRDESSKGSERTLRSGRILMRKQSVAPSVPSADMKSTVSETGKPGRRSRSRRFVNGNPARTEGLVPMLLVHCQWSRSSRIHCCKRREDPRAWVQDAYAQVSEE